MKTRFFAYQLLAGFLMISSVLHANELGVTSLTCEGEVRPLAVEAEHPRFSWKLVSDQQSVRQATYRILVSDHPKVAEGNVWDSGEVKSEQSLWVPYGGPSLEDGRRYYWKIQVTDNKGNSSGWSETALFGIGLRSEESWEGAHWIGREELPEEKRIVPAIEHTQTEGLEHVPLPIFRREFLVEKLVASATAFVSGLGHFRLSLNGEPVSDHFLDPAWTDYDESVFYVAYDVTGQLKQKNALGLMLGNGMYFVPKARYRKFVTAFGYPKAKLKLVIAYKDGSREVIVTDELWRMDRSPITFSSIFGGEDYDARQAQKGWGRPGFDDSGWSKPLIVNSPKGTLRAQMSPPLVVADTMTVKNVARPKPDTWVYDLGQNASGIPTISVSGKRGGTVKITPGELLDDNGLVTQQASGSPYFLQYTLSGDDEEQWQPAFTYYGFRYLQVEGAVPDTAENPQLLPVLKNIKGLHTRSSSPQVGTFTTSDTLFSQIFDLINWSIKSNLSHVLTDCPHREKLGWLEVSYLMGYSIQYNFNIHRLYTKQVADIMQAQLDSGMIPSIAPEYPEFDGGFRDSPEWGSASILLPWEIYRWYGDSKPLQEAWPTMQRYITYLQSRANEHIISYGLGDWFDIGPEHPGPSQLTPQGVTATAIYYKDLQVMADAAALFEKEQDHARYDSLAQVVRNAFNQTYFNSGTAQYATGSQTANSMALYLGLAEPWHEETVFQNLIDGIREKNNSIVAGDIGFRFLIQSLEQRDRADVIFDMNHQTNHPGYGYQLVRGATALTESWQAYRFVSNNHCMLGHLMEWFYSGLAGIGQTETSVAYKHLFLRPQPVEGISDAGAIFESPYGEVVSKWQKKDGRSVYHTRIPPNSSATVALPAESPEQITVNGNLLSQHPDILIEDSRNGRIYLKTGSGIYEFEIRDS